jgi:hypothetical protein
MNPHAGGGGYLRAQTDPHALAVDSALRLTPDAW